MTSTAKSPSDDEARDGLVAPLPRRRWHEAVEVHYAQAFLGQWKPPAGHEELPKRRAFTRLEARAARRLEEIAHLARLRYRIGGAMELAGLLRVAADALFELSGTGWLGPTSECLQGQIPPGMTSSTTDLKWALERPRHPGRLIANFAAGKHLNFTIVERDMLGRDGIVMRALVPFDETSGARAGRKREATRLRTIRYRKSMRLQHTRSVTDANVSSETNVSLAVTHLLYKEQRHAANVSFRAGKIPAAVVQAVRDGCTTIPEILMAVGGNKPVIEKALGRLVAAGAIQKLGRGRYGPPDHGGGGQPASSSEGHERRV